MILCPGQGAQYLGMLGTEMNGTTHDLLKQATKILGFDIFEITKEHGGTKDMLDRYVVLNALCTEY